MGYRKQRFAALFCAAAVIILGGCGDDLTQQVYIPGREDLAQPIGGYNATTQAGQTAEDSATGAQTGTASGGENATTSGSCHDSGDLTGERYTITISAAGDVTLGNHQEQDYSASFRQAYDQAEDEGYFFENVRDIFAADDMTIVNLEGPLTTSEQMREGQTYCIKGDPAYAHLLTLGSIEAVSFANNHRLDYGEQGSRDTVVALEQEGIIYAYDKNVGIYEIPDSAAAHGGERNLKIGIISVNEVEWGAQAEKLIQNNIETLREQNVDLILANATSPLQAAVSATSTIPVLGTSITDYGVALGVDNWTGVSGTNISGTSDLAPLDGQAAMVQELFPDAKTIGLLYCSGEPNSIFQADSMEALLTDMGYSVERYTFADSNDVSSVTANACSNSDVLYIPTDNTAASCTEAINNVALSAGIPIVAGEEGLASGCGVATLSISYYDLGRATGEMAAEILTEGADVSTMEVRFAPAFTKEYNADICEALNITVPEDYIAIAK